MRAVVLTALLLSAGCRRQVVRVEVPVPGPPRPCLAAAPPARATYTVVEGGACPAGYGCLTEADGQALADELDARRRWDEIAWARCRE